VLGTKRERAEAFKQIVFEYFRAFLRKAPFEDTLSLLTSVMNSVDQYKGSKNSLDYSTMLSIMVSHEG